MEKRQVFRLTSLFVFIFVFSLTMWAGSVSAKSYSVQVGSYKDMNMAAELEKELQEKGYDPFIVLFRAPSGTVWHRVRIGSFEDRYNAEELADQLEMKEGFSSLIVLQKKDPEIVKIESPIKPPERMEKSVEGEKSREKSAPSSELKRNVEVTRLVYDWRDAWERKDLESFIALYSRNYGSEGMDFNAWRENRKRNFSARSEITVDVRDIKIVSQDGLLKVSFRQEYGSGSVLSVGIKSLFLRKEKGRWKIVSQSFTSAK